MAKREETEFKRIDLDNTAPNMRSNLNGALALVCGKAAVVYRCAVNIAWANMDIVFLYVSRITADKLFHLLHH